MVIVTVYDGILAIFTAHFSDKNDQPLQIFGQRWVRVHSYHICQKRILTATWMLRDKCQSLSAFELSTTMFRCGCDDGSGSRMLHERNQIELSTINNERSFDYPSLLESEEPGEIPSLIAEM
jgi:hypothetical protein